MSSAVGRRPAVSPPQLASAGRSSAVKLRAPAARSGPTPWGSAAAWAAASRRRMETARR